MKKLIYPSLIVICLAICVDIIYLTSIWPNWDKLKQGAIPESTFIQDYRQKKKSNPKLPPLRWQSSQRSIPRDVSLPFIVAEDSRFYSHEGVDLDALINAMKYNLNHGKMLLGASTISQQTTKNLFLSSSRDLFRKWHELILTKSMEVKLSKSRILQIYLNIAEFGHGVYGIHSAAQFYYGKSIDELNTFEISGLAACLPSPKKHNPSSNSTFFQKKRDRILTIMEKYYSDRMRWDNPPNDPEISTVSETLSPTNP